jgi:head-tail adaptor
MPGLTIPAGRRDRLITIERPEADDALDGAGSGAWVEVGQEWAEVQDRLPSKGERTEGGFNLASRPARVRMPYREDITSDMRFVLGDRIMQIVAGPAELGRRQGLEFMVEDYRPAGNTA